MDGSAREGRLAFTIRFYEREEGLMCATQCHQWAVEVRGRRKVDVLCLGLLGDSGVGHVELYRVLQVYGRGEGEGG